MWKCTNNSGYQRIETTLLESRRISYFPVCFFLPWPVLAQTIVIIIQSLCWCLLKILYYNYFRWPLLEVMDLQSENPSNYISDHLSKLYLGERRDPKTSPRARQWIKERNRHQKIKWGNQCSLKDYPWWQNKYCLLYILIIFQHHCRFCTIRKPPFRLLVYMQIYIFGNVPLPDGKKYHLQKPKGSITPLNTFQYKVF